MNYTYTLLSPVKEEELRLTFGVSQTLSGVIDPDRLFEPTINHFRKLAIGTYFWFVADPAKWIVHSAGGMLEKITPIKESEFVQHPPDILFKNTHPEDMAQMFAFSNYWVTYYSGLPPEKKPCVQATIYLRMLNANYVYNWVMVQYADTIIDGNGTILYGLTLVTDISHIKKEGIAMMSILDTTDETCQQFLCIDGKSLSSTGKTSPRISIREIEVLRYLAIGYSSKQIAAELSIAIKTIDNHRQNLLRKTATKSTGELVAYAINMGYI